MTDGIHRRVPGSGRIALGLSLTLLLAWGLGPVLEPGHGRTGTPWPDAPTVGRGCADPYSQPSATAREEAALAGLRLDLFAEGVFPRVELELGPDALRSLTGSPRAFVRSNLRIDGAVLANVAVRLKGSSGSFRGLDDKPAFTVDVARFKPDQRLEGRRRFYLQNAVEDPSFLCEQIGAEMCRTAGIPAPRVSHVRVSLNGRPLGRYLLKEGFDESWRVAQFGVAGGGTLFDNDLGCDVDQVLNTNGGSDPDRAREALARLNRALREPDHAARLAAMDQVLDLERFLTFMAMEVMLGHRDGYCCARNNFRIFHHPETDRLMFLPDGMDQLFGLEPFPWRPHMSGLVANAIVETEAGGQRYAARFRDLMNRVFDTARWTARIDAVMEGLEPRLTPREFREWRAEATRLKERLVRRRAELERQLEQAEATPLVFTDSQAPLQDWTEADAASAASMESAGNHGGPNLLGIRSGARTTASWRTRVMLPPGSYRFEGRVRTLGVTALPFGRHHGATLRIAGTDAAAERLTGDTPWRQLATSFTVQGPARRVDLLCELRASSGELWVDRDSLRLLRLTNGNL